MVIALSLAALGAVIGSDRSALAAGGVCPPEATLAVQNVPSSLPWGNRATIRVIAPPDAEITRLSAAWADSGEVFAQANEHFDFWIEAEHPDPTIGFVVSWTARYLDSNLLEQTCSGTLAPVIIRSGLDRRLVINSSLAAIKLNEPEARVRRILGAPARITRPYSSLRIYHYRAWKLQVWMYASGGRWSVQSVRTTSRAFRTDRAVGVGTTFTTLKRRHGGFACFLAGNSAFQQCLKRQMAPRPTTIFNGARGKITSIALTLMGD